MDRELDKDELGLRSSGTLIHYRKSHFTILTGVETPPCRPKLNEEKAVIETPNKFKGLGTKSVPRHTSFQQRELTRGTTTSNFKKVNIDGID
jgi:hypothetical protein